MHTSSLKGYFLWKKLIHQNLISDKGGGGVSQFLIFSDNGGRGGGPISDFGWQGRGVWTPPFLVNVICEQPLTGKNSVFSFFLWIWNILTQIWSLTVISLSFHISQLLKLFPTPYFLLTRGRGRVWASISGWHNIWTSPYLGKSNNQSFSFIFLNVNAY